MRPSIEELKAARTGIGAAIRALHSDVLREAVPERISELLWQIDQLFQVGEASSRCDSACRQLTPQDPGASTVAAALLGAPKEPMASVANRRTALPPEANGCDMLKMRKFNADAAAHLARFVAASIDLRSGTVNRVEATREALAESRMLISSLNAVLDATPTGWPPKGWLCPPGNAVL
jgi:hypothetical protein